MIRFRRSLGLALLSASIVAAQATPAPQPTPFPAPTPAPSPAPKPAPAPAPATGPAPVRSPSPPPPPAPPAEPDPAPAWRPGATPATPTAPSGLGTSSDPLGTPGPGTFPGPLTPPGPAVPPGPPELSPTESAASGRWLSRIEDDATTIAARKLAALLDPGRLESEIVEATGVSRKTVGGLVKSILRARVTSSRSGQTSTLLAPEAGVEITVRENAAARVRPISPAKAEEVVRRTEVAVDNAASALKPEARGAFRAWWTSKLKALEAASAALKAAMTEAAATAEAREQERQAARKADAARRAAAGAPATADSTEAAADRVARRPARSQAPAAPRTDRVKPRRAAATVGGEAVESDDVPPAEEGDDLPPPDDVDSAPPSDPATPGDDAVATSPRVYRLPSDRLNEALARRRAENPDEPVDPRALFVELGVSPADAAKLERDLYVEDLARARADALLGDDRASRVLRVLEADRARADGEPIVLDGAKSGLAPSPNSPFGDARNRFFAASRPAVDDYRRAVENELRAAADEARRTAERLRADAAARNAEVERAVREEIERARAAEQEALEKHRRSLDEFRRLREQQVQELRKELEALRREVQELRKTQEPVGESRGGAKGGAQGGASGGGQGGGVGSGGSGQGGR